MSTTPGDWEAVADDRVISRLPDGTERPVCLLSHHAPGSRTWTEASMEARANGRLIAAAPDLLAACEACLYSNALRDEDGGAYGMLRAAVSKIRGEAPMTTVVTWDDQT